MISQSLRDVTTNLWKSACPMLLSGAPHFITVYFNMTFHGPRVTLFLPT
mgnify:CR=1 FL=1